MDTTHGDPRELLMNRHERVQPSGLEPRVLLRQKLIFTEGGHRAYLSRSLLNPMRRRCQVHDEESRLEDAPVSILPSPRRGY